MKGISHQQAVKLIHLRMDGLLKGNQNLSLEAHLESCDSCRAYAAEMDVLTRHWQNEFQARWDGDTGPSHRVFEHVTTRARKIPMTNRIFAGIRLMASGFFVVLLILGINFMVLQMKSNPINTNGTQSVSGSELGDNRLIAFTSEKDGNFDIYIMSGDGSNLTNITNNPAQDVRPVWSPDGKHIAFESDRAGTKQIYLMNSDGSNIVQLTHDEVDHQLPVTYDSEHSIWSSDGNKILFLQNDPDGKTWTLSSIQINGVNKTTLVRDSRRFDTASWSPTGDYVGLLLFDELEPDRLVPSIYVIDADGNNLREIKSFLPQEEHIFPPYIWSSDGQSVIFPAHELSPSGQTVYEFRLSDNTLTTVTMIQFKLFDWYDGIALINDFSIESQPLVWQRPNGTSTTLDYLKGANPADCYIDKERSLRGNLAIGSYCKQDDKVLLYWTNADGSDIQQLPALNVPVMNGGLIGLTLSPDEKFVTFNFESEDETNLYIWNIEEALKDTSVQPIKLLVGKSKLRYIPAWQPILSNDIVEEERTQPDNKLIAFTSDQGGNAEIYTMYSDGSNLTNLTNYSAHDVNPIWSPDGKRIAFESDRTGYIQIYTMNADGSNLMQITNEEADHAIGTEYGDTPEPWSPEGRKIIISQTVRGDENNMLYVMDVDGSNKMALTDEPGLYTFLGWSPDGRKIVYQISNASNNGDTRIMVASIDGTSTFDGPFFEGDGGRTHHQIQWETSEQFITLSSNSERPLWGLWNLTRFYTTEESYINYSGSNPILVTSNSPIVAIFDRTYVVENQDSLSWFVYSGTPIPFAPWSFSDLCKTPTDPLVAETFHTISPDKQRDFVSLNCPEGTTYFFLMNLDGTEIQQLDASIAGQSQVNALTWSPDGKHVIVTATTGSTTNRTSLFRFDVQEMLNDPSVKPIQLTTDEAWKYGVAWQPLSNHEIVEEISNPEPTPITESKQTPPIGIGKEGNGKWIAFLASPDGIKSDVYIIHPDGNGLCCINNLTNAPDHYFWLEWSPNGNDLLFLRESDISGGINILRKTEPASFEVLVHTGVSREAPFLYRWSPNSEKIAYIDNLTGNFDIYTIYADGRNDIQPKQLTNDPGQEIDFAWSTDGSQIAYQRTNGEQLSIMVMNADGSNQQEVARGVGKVRLYWSVNGNSIYVSSTENNWLECDGCVQAPAIYRIDLNGLSIHQIYYEMDADQYTGWYLYDTPQGMLYFMRIDRPDFVELWGTWFRADGNSVTQIGKLDPQQTCQAAVGNVLNESLSPNSRFSVVSNFCGGRFDLYLADREAMPEKQLTHLLQLPQNTLGQGGDFATLPMTWSPDGRWIAYDNGNAAIYLLSIEANRQDPVTKRGTGPLLLWQSENDLITFSEIAWQPFSNHAIVEEEPTPEPTQTSASDNLIVFAANSNDDANVNMDIYSVAPDGSNLTNLTHHPAQEFTPIWSPDGTRIAFMSNRDGNNNLYAMNADGSGLVRLSIEAAVLSTVAVWSPDSQKIAYRVAGPSNGSSNIAIVDSDGQNHRILTSYAAKRAAWSAAWSPDGQFLFFDFGQGIVKVDVDSGTTEPVTTFTDVNPLTDFALSKDGTQLLYLTATCDSTNQSSTDLCYTIKTKRIDGTSEETLQSLKPSEVCPVNQTTTWMGSYTKWSPDRTKILFLFTCADDGWIYIANADGSHFRPLINYPIPGNGSENVIPTADWSADSEAIIFTSALNSPEGENLYILNINDAPQNPALLPSPLNISLSQITDPDWKPIP